jgi:hypothetical protein
MTYFCSNADLYSEVFVHKFDVHGSVHLGNIYIRLQVRDAHSFFMCSLLHYACFTCFGCYQEHKLQSTAEVCVICG